MENHNLARSGGQSAVSRPMTNSTTLSVPKAGVANRLLAWFARRVLLLIGWRVEGALPNVLHYVAIGAPHTSNFDLPISMLAAASLTEGFTTIRIAWLGKHTIFVGPFDWLFRKLGGIPVHREAGHHVVKTVIQAIRASERLALVMAPEGTRKRVEYWKPGFYYIARLAKVPILCGYLDYKRKVMGLGPLIYPTNDVEADMRAIREFYSTVTARHPERVGPIRLQRGEIPS